MTALILQARLDSSRLPGKSLLPLGGEPLIFRVMKSLNFINCDIKILACPKECMSSFDALAKKAGFEIFGGPKDDVLARFCLAIKRFKPDRIIRATGDNPFVFIDAAKTLNKETAEQNADYGLYTEIPHGTGVECVLSEALLSADIEAQSPYDREHVCPYLYNNPKKFKLYLPQAPLKWQGKDINCSVDTKADYLRAAVLYDLLSDSSHINGYRGEDIIRTYKDQFCL